MREAPEVRWMKSTAGQAALVGIGVAAAAATIAWVRRAKGEERRERELMLAAAAGGTVVGLGYVVALKQRGLISGGLMDLPSPVLWAYETPVAIGFNTLWLAGMRKLTQGAAHPWWITGLLNAAMAPAVLAVEPWEMKRGYFKMSRDFKVGYNAVATSVMMWAPSLMYEGLKRTNWRREVERPEAVWAEACEPACAPVGVG